MTNSAYLNSSEKHDGSLSLSFVVMHWAERSSSPLSLPCYIYIYVCIPVYEKESDPEGAGNLPFSEGRGVMAEVAFLWNTNAS